MQSVQGKGLGMVATRVIQQGEIVTKETAVMNISGNETAGKLAALEQQLSMLPPDKQQSVLSLHALEEGDAKIARIFDGNCIQASGESAGLFPTIARINHSCRPNVVWGDMSGRSMGKEVRATRRIQAGEEICANYLDEVNTNFNEASYRQAALAKWGFHCQCVSCSLPPQEQEEDDRMRSECGRLDGRVTEMVERQDLTGALRAARDKLRILLRLQDSLTTDLPSAYMEMFELLSISRVFASMGEGVDSEDPEEYRRKAEELSTLLGDRFVEGYRRKYREVLYG